MQVREYIFSNILSFLFDRKLATTHHFTDLKVRLDLINFALCFCPLEEIQIVLRERKVIEAQVKSTHLLL